MARNSEKAQSMLFRFRAAQAAESGLLLPSAGQRRPKAPSSITQIPVCEKWRGQVLKEISRKVTKIQDESLSDFQIRDMNDEINRLMKEKWGWERRIRELGGPNYMRGAGTTGGDGGLVKDGPGAGGGKGYRYRYFGRARELPGVKEIFERAAKRSVQQAQMERDGDGGGARSSDLARKNVDAAYFGYGLDEEDGSLLRYERMKEREAVQRLNGLRDDDGGVEGGVGWEPLPGDAGDGVGWRLPTVEEVQDELVERRRRKLLDKIG
jgi:pre-mRNA-splicing factor ISY1